MKNFSRLFFLCLWAIFVITLSANAQKKTPGREGKPKAKSAAQPKPAEKPEAEKKEEKKEDKYRGMSYRQVGPFRGGRSLTAVGIPGDPKTYYFGATGGGVWKSTDAGASWAPIFLRAS